MSDSELEMAFQPAGIVGTERIDISPSGGRDEEISRALAALQAFVTSLGNHYQIPGDLYAAAEQNRAKLTGEVRDLADNLTLGMRWNGAQVPDTFRPTQLKHAEFMSEMKAATYLAWARKPLLKSARLERRRLLEEKARPVIGSVHGILDSYKEHACSAAREAAKQSLDTLHQLDGRLWHQALVSEPRNSAVVDWWRVNGWTVGDRPEVAAPVISPGTAILQRVDLTVQVETPYDDLVTDEYSLAFDQYAPAFQIKFDLDQVGGFYSGHKAPLEVAAVDLLTQLQGGRVKVDVIDPLQLGDSAKFLYDLNDAGDRILADAVWTTPEDIARVLGRLEQHITFVTQKYLQGRTSLTEYNLEAGEIAEPYRLLMLYDFPSGFSRDGKHFDEEHLNRLRRIADVGRRAGVFIFAHVSDSAFDRHLEALTELSKEGLDLPATAAGDAELLRVAELNLDWAIEINPRPTDKERQDLFAGLLRDLQSAETAKVLPATISRLAKARYDLDQQRGLTVEPSIDLGDLTTWWQGSSATHIQMAFGRLGASDVARLDFNSDLESSALIGGRTGSGKSSLIHAIIMDAVTRYSPAELELYLCDLKEGIEFKQYADAGLPHAKAIAIESNREFAISLLEALDQEILKRGEAFKKADGAPADIRRFREISGETWPRIMVVIDEFHKLFEREDQLAKRAMYMLERVIKEGRAFGIHTILASQTLTNVSATFRNLAGQIIYRLVLPSSEHDSRVLLGENNADAMLLTRAGEGILNAKGGAKEANQRFQTVYWDSEERALALSQIVNLAEAAGFDRKPEVFEGNAQVRADDFPAAVFLGDGKPNHLSLPVGAPMSLAPPMVTTLERAAGSNLLVIDDAGLEQVVVLITSLVAQGAGVDVVDFSSISQEWEEAFEALAEAGVRKSMSRRIDEVLDALVAEVQERHSTGNYSANSHVLVLAGLQRARDFDAEDYSSESVLAKARVIAKDGPEVGIHVIAWADRRASLDRRFDRDMTRQFGLKFLGRMDPQDLRDLADAVLDADLSDAQVLFDDFDRTVTAVVRKFGFPGVGWVRDTVRSGS